MLRTVLCLSSPLRTTQHVAWARSRHAHSHVAAGEGEDLARHVMTALGRRLDPALLRHEHLRLDEELAKARHRVDAADAALASLI